MIVYILEQLLSTKVAYRLILYYDKNIIIIISERRANKLLEVFIRYKLL